MLIRILSTFSLLFITITSFSQQLNQMILSDWKNGEWENRMRELPFYDDEGRLTRKEIAHWNSSTQEWVDYTKTEFNRNSDGILLNKETWKWNQETSNWDFSTKSTYTVNEKNQPILVVTEDFEANGWINESMEELDYDAKGNVIEKRLSRWNQSSLSWAWFQKFNYRSDGYRMENGRKTGYTIYVWNHVLNDWGEYKKASYHYDESGICDHILYQTSVDDDWGKDAKRINLRDNEGRLIGTEVEVLENDAWRKSSHVDYTLTDFGKIETSTSKIWFSSAWENLQRSTYYYSEDGEMISEWGTGQELELFPNPTSEMLTIRALPQGRLTVQDALGKIVYQTENTENEIQLNVADWEMGAYSIQIDGREIQQFLKQ